MRISIIFSGMSHEDRRTGQTHVAHGGDDPLLRADGASARAQAFCEQLPRLRRGPVGRLEFIRHCRTLDISLDEIRLLLESIEDGSPEGADRAHVMIHRHLEAVEARMAELRRLREQLCSLAGACCGRHAEGEPCGLLERLSHPGGADDGPDVP